MISNLINNKTTLKRIQRQNLNNVTHKPLKSVIALDKLRITQVSLKKNKSNLKILHISNFGIKNDYRIFNLSIARKISNGLIKNGHDVINFDYRNFNEGFIKKTSLDKKIISIIKNYRPNLVLLGHNNSLTRSTLISIKKKI